MSEDGNKLLELLKDRFIFPSSPGPMSESYAYSCIYYEGFREAFRQLINCVDSYKKRMDAEAVQVHLKGAEINESV